MEQNTLIMIAVTAFGVLAGICIFVTAYFIRREYRLLNRIQKMLDDAIEGAFEDKHLDESKISAIENSMWRYLCDNHMAYQKISAEKEQIQELISDISHQTVIPISNIMLYSQLIEENLSSQILSNRPETVEETVEELAAIREQTEKLDFLVESLVKLSRLEIGIINVTVKKQSIAPMLRAVQNQFEPKAERKRIRFQVENTDKIAVFDLKWTIEAVANIVDNAIKYTPLGGEVAISVTSYSFFVRIDVKDNGIGISETEQANIFTRFYRSLDVNQEPGIGIGLYLAREVIKVQNGYIKVNSKVREGSVFSLFLPKEEMSPK